MLIAVACDWKSYSKWKHWKIIKSYVWRIAKITDRDNLDILVNLQDTSVYLHISEGQNYEEAILLLDSAYIKPVNKIYARRRLKTSKKQRGETLQNFYQRLKKLSADCNYAVVSAVQNRVAAMEMRSLLDFPRVISDSVCWRKLRTVFGKA